MSFLSTDRATSRRLRAWNGLGSTVEVVPISSIVVSIVVPMAAPRMVSLVTSIVASIVPWNKRCMVVVVVGL